jgi:TRAP-type C4-dicarboxylate transport system substrate-binding protein
MLNSRREKTMTMRHLLAGALAALGVAAAQAQVVIKLGTVAPEGSIWHDTLLETRQRWREISNGEVELRIYAGGVLGGEDEMIRKMQRRGLDALTISGSGLPLIDGIVDCLNLPMFFDSYEELDEIRSAIAPDLERRFEERGYRVLNWSEAGWVYFFAKAPIRTPDELREQRLWIGPGDPKAEQLAKELGLRVVPLPATDMLTGLQTGLIEAIDVPPLFALLDRSYQSAPFMIDLRFAPLNAATVITRSAWERISDGYRARFLEAAHDAVERMRVGIHTAEVEAIDEMVARGLQVVRLEPAEIELWRDEAEAVYPRLSCASEHPALFAEVMRLRNP